MNKLKRIFACILMWAMVLNVCSPMANVHASDAVNSGALTVHRSTSEKRILVTAEATEKPTLAGVLSKVAGSASITLSGKSNGYLYYEGGIYYVIFDGLTIEEDAEVTIKGQFKASDGFIINVQETTFKYNSAATPKWAIKNDVTPVDSGTLTVDKGTSEKRILVTAEATEKPTVAGVLSKVSGSGSITLNGAAQGYLYYEKGIYYVIFDGLTIEEGAEVIVKGQFKAKDGFIINMQETTFKYNSAATPKWVNKNDVTPVDSGALTVHKDTSDKRILVTTEATEKPTVAGVLSKVAESGSITLNGTAQGYLYYEKGIYYVVFDGLTIEAGSVVTVKGQFKAKDEFIINVQETTFLCVDPTGAEGAYWKIATAADFAEYQEVTVNAAVNPSGYNTSAQRYDFYFDLNETVGDTTSTITGMQYAINDGEKKSLTALMQPHLGETLLAVVWIPEVTEPTKITFSGKGILSGNNEKGISLKNEVSVYINEYGWSMDGFVKPTAYVETGVSELLTNAIKYANEEQGWHFYFGLSKKNEKIAADAVLVGFQYSINGGEKKDLTAYYSGYSDGSLFFIMPELEKNIAKNTKITISGQAKTTDGKNGLKLTDEVILYGNEYGWSLTGYPKATKYSKVTGKELDGATKWNKYQGDQRWEFYLQLDGDTSKIPEHAMLSGFEYSLNDSKTKQPLGECFWSPHAGGTMLFVVRDIEPEKLTKNTKITISGRGKTTDGAYGLELTKEVTIYGNQYGWSMSGYPKEPTYTKVNVTGVNGATGYIANANRWDIYLNVDTMLPGADDSEFRSLKVEIDGKTYNTMVYHAGHQDTLFFSIDGSMMAKDVKNGTKIVLKAGKAIQEGKGIGIQLMKDVTLYKFYDGLTNKKPTTNTKFTDVTIVQLARATKYMESSNIWPLYLRIGQEIPGDNGTKFYDLKAVLNGKEVSLKATKEGKVLFIPIPTTLLDKNAKTGTLTIKAGTKSVGGAGEVGIKILEDFNIYLFNGVWSEDKFEEIIDTELFCTRLHNCTHNSTSTLWGFYLKTNKEFPGRPWYNKFDRFQVELNGKNVTVELNKGDGSRGRIIYFGLDEKVVGKFKEGSILTIKANSVAEDGAYKTTFTKDFSLIFTNGMWIEYRQTDKVAPAAQNLWDVARFDSAYIPQSEDGTVYVSGYDDYTSITSTEKLMDQTIKFTGKKFYDDVIGYPFHIVLRGNQISETEPISRSLLYGYVITFEGYEITEENTPNSPELWGTRSAFINVWKNGENAALADQYQIGTHHAVTNDPYFKFNETYEYEVSIYNITETSVCIEFKVNGELAYKCYDDASTDPMDPVVNPGTFGIYVGVPTYIGGETVELETVLSEATECKVGDKVGVAATYPSIIKDAVFTVDKKGAAIEEGYFVADKVGTYTISATYKGKELKPVTITVSEQEVIDADAGQKNNTTAIIIIVITTVILVAGATTLVILTKRRRKND